MARWDGTWLAEPEDVDLISVGAAEIRETRVATNERFSTVGSSLVRSARTSDTILAAADNGTMIDITGASTFTQTFTAAATLGSGWFCYYRNSGTGDVTLDPDGAEHIDGLDSFIMYPGECRLIQCDGTGFNSVVVSPFRKQYITTADFVKPPGYSYFGGMAWSAGGSGRRTNSVSTASPGGGGGGCFPFNLPASLFAATETVTIGAGGAAITGVATGNAGGNTSIGTVLIVYGGGVYSLGGAIGIAGACRATAAHLAVGFEASSTSCENTVYGGGSSSANGTVASASSIFGGGAGGSISAAEAVQSAGSSIYGGDGGDAASASSGTDGADPAGGGGATQTGVTSGKGGRGELQIWGIA
jgi:hypothetical protein